MPIVQIAGYSFWLNFLPSLWRARLIAENVRQCYGGKMPAGNFIGREAVDGVQLQLPTGEAFVLRETGTEPVPPRNDVGARMRRTWSSALAAATWPRRVAVATAIALALVSHSLAARFARLTDYFLEWAVDLRIASGRTNYRRWEVAPIPLPRLPERTPR